MTLRSQLHVLFFIVLFGFVCLMPVSSARAQDYVTGAFEGDVTDSVNNTPVADATVQIINKDTGVPAATRTNSQGRFSHGLLPPGDYIIRVSREGYVPYETEQPLRVLRPTRVVPVPVKLTPQVAAIPTPGPTESPTPVSGQPTPQPTPVTQPTSPNIEAEINTTDAQRGGAFNEREVSTLPLGATTITRTFDELGLLLPGVARPPQTQGSVAGPGVGAGVGSAGQFAVNGLRSRANNFTVDGSDNNDEDIGVRRQGFFALVPQPIESIKEFQMITLLAPAQYGRNFGAQVNAISKSGGNETHGAFYGFLNASQLNARNFFDTTNGNAFSPLFGGNNQRVLNCGVLSGNLFVFLNACAASGASRQIRVLNQSGGEDSFTLSQGGLVLGGPLVPTRSDRSGRGLFYFISMEGQVLNASKEVSFVVPTVSQRGFGNTGASGVAATPLPDINGAFPVNSPNFFFPTTGQGDAVFSLFPFPNNPNGVFGANTFTQTLPASAQGRVLSGKVDANFNIGEKRQSFTARYNFTQDWREIPATGGAIFSTLRPRVRTQNFSTFLNSQLSGSNSSTPIYNQIRLSYGRTRLNFEEVRDRSFLIQTGFDFANPEDARFLLNAPVLGNFTTPDGFGAQNTGPVLFASSSSTTEDELGPIGQLNIAGFSPVGVDVFNFPQRRVNNTYQLADTLTVHTGSHQLSFGADIRRTELNSDLPLNARPVITFGGGPQLTFSSSGNSLVQLGRFIPAVSLAAAGAPSGFRQTFNTTGNSSIGLRYYQWNFFGQDEWRVRPNLSFSLGLRYEYNTPPKEQNRAIESTFSSPSLSSLPGLSSFIDGRTGIFDSDRNNFAPRVGFAYSPRIAGDRLTVIRAGYGIFYDQILGAVVSQSRNVFPTFITADFAGGGFGTQFGELFGFNPAFLVPLQPGQLNRVDLGGLTLQQFVQLLNVVSTGSVNTSGIAPTLPARQLQTPMAHHYAATLEQQLGRDTALSVGYVGTLGRDLLRLTTPNLGPNAFIVPIAVDAFSLTTDLFGFALPPGSRFNPVTGAITGGRPVPGLGAISLYQTIASSRYDALQVQVRGRYNMFNAFQANYTFSKATDDASDMFDLAGAPALPQNSFTFAGERSPSNFDVRHRVSYNYILDLSPWGKHGSFTHAVFNGLEVAGTGIFETGQPFTVNSINDVNLDGNLTDRLNSTSGIVETGDRAQPLRLTVNPDALLAPIGQDGAVPRNSFRAGNIWLTNVAVIKAFHISEQTKLVFRTEAFNLFNRANFGIPVRFLESPGFGRATDTLTPGRRIQFALKVLF
jgi:hypothetical protein